MRISHQGIVSSVPACLPQRTTTARRSRTRPASGIPLGRRNNLQTFHRPVDTIGKPQDLNPAIPLIR